MGRERVSGGREGRGYAQGTLQKNRRRLPARRYQRNAPSAIAICWPVRADAPYASTVSDWIKVLSVKLPGPRLSVPEQGECPSVRARGSGGPMAGVILMLPFADRNHQGRKRAGNTNCSVSVVTESNFKYHK